MLNLETNSDVVIIIEDYLKYAIILTSIFH